MFSSKINCVIFFIALQLLFTKVFGTCLQAQFGKKTVPKHIDGYSHEWVPEESFNDVKITCNDVTFPFKDNGIQYCNCYRTLEISSVLDTVLHPNSIPNIDNIYILILNNLSISKIYPGAFGQHHFTEIYLSNNEIENIEVGIFNPLMALEVLDMSYNYIKKIPHHSLIGSTSLKRLYLSNNELTDFSFNIFDPNVKRMDYIDLSFNNLSYFTVDAKIEVLNISLNNNRIKQTELCLLNFNSLNLKNNLLNSLPLINCDNDNYKNRLINFDISFNEISTIPQFYFKNASNLEYLFLNHNNISNLPISVFFRLDHLKQLNLSENRLQQFEYGTFDSLRSLEILDLSFNDIKNINTALHALTKLKKLYLHNNKISNLDTYINKEFFSGFFSLEKISFYNNNFSSCHDLLQFSHSFRNYTHIVHGTVSNSTNIYGISCSDTQNPENYNANFENLKSNIENVMTSFLKESNNKNIEEKDVLKDYFNNDFKNSNFYKFMANFQESSFIKFNETEIFKYFNNDFENSKFYKYLESLKDTKNFTDFKKNMYDYFNNDFKNSGFVKYLDDLKNYKISLNEDFSKSSMYNYFNKDFEQSKFYRYLENLRNPVSTHFQNNPEFEKLVNSEKPDDKRFVVAVTINTIFVIFICFLLCVLIYNMYYKKVLREREQVELIQA